MVRMTKRIMKLVCVVSLFFCAVSPAANAFDKGKILSTKLIEDYDNMGTYGFDLPLGVPIKLMHEAKYENGVSGNINAVSTFSISNANLATVDSSGVIVGQQLGSTVVTATYGSFVSNATFRVIPPNELRFTSTAYGYDREANRDVVILSANSKVPFSLMARYNWDELRIETKASFESSDPSVVTVSSGEILALKNGSANVTASFGGVSLTIPVKVNGFSNPLTNLDTVLVNQQKNNSIQLLNDLRVAAGAGALKEVEALTKSAQSHSNYLSQNFTLEEYEKFALNAHNESSSKPGFTGVGPGERAKLYGYSYRSVSEGLARVENGNNAALKLLISAPVHRNGLMDPTLTDIGVGITPGSNPYSVFVTMSDWSTRDSQTPIVITYPYSGQTAIPTSWYAAEAPNPLNPHRKENTWVGYPISISAYPWSKSKLSYKSGSIKDPSGQNIDFYRTDGTNFGNGADSYIFLFAKEALKPWTTYTVTVEADLTAFGKTAPWSKTWSFTTGEAPAGLTPSGEAQQNARTPATPANGKTPLPKPAGTNPGSSYISFADSKGHWAENTISWAVQNKIVEGYEDNSFRPNKQVSEAEFIAMLFRSLKVDLNDVSAPAGGHWSEKLYQYAEKMKYPLTGYKDVKQRDIPLTRLHVAEIIAAADGKSLSGNDAIQYLLDQKYSQGKTSATVDGYKGDELLTRAESIQFLKNLNELQTGPLKAKPAQ